LWQPYHIKNLLQGCGKRFVTEPGFRGISIPQELADKIDKFVKANEWGYRSRADVVAAAVREFLQRHSASGRKKP
jgi:hypothetical protein